ncbi:MAG: hypothetical protein ACOX9E_08610 [Lentisphaeria bacterium]
MSSAQPFSVVADFPGANIAVDRIDGNDIYVHQELRGTHPWWFHWAFRVLNANGRKLNVHFTERIGFPSMGVAVSTDCGATWHWTGPQALFPKEQAKGFSVMVPGGADDIRFAITIPYQQSNLEDFLQEFPQLRCDTLCHSRHGRPVELLRAGRLDGLANYKLYLSSRHHACEAIGTWVLEAIIRAALADTPTGHWFQENVEILAVPFVDKDGVEEGDQGKDRRPHDHNRDYAAELYPEIIAIKKLLPTWIGNSSAIALDLHCPYFDGKCSYMVKVGDKKNLDTQRRFVQILERTHSGPGAFLESDHGDWEKGGNIYKNGVQSTLWLSTLPGILLTGTIEVPYAQIRDAVISIPVTRSFGDSIAKALRELWLS